MARRKERGPDESSFDGATAFRVQDQIRRNAQDMQEYLTDFGNWERSIKKKDRQLSRKASSASPAAGGSPPIRRGERPPVSVRAGPAPETPGESNDDESHGGDAPCAATPGGEKAVAEKRPTAATVSAARHTHDKGYDKWAKFDVDAALRSVDGEDPAEEEKKSLGGKSSSSDSDTDKGFQDKRKRTSRLTPATMADRSAGRAMPRAPVARHPKPLAKTTKAAAPGDLEKEERERGNAKFVAGDFEGAVKCYTRCLGINSKSCLAFSNRAMAYLKLKEFGKAEADGNAALKLDPRHVKSLQRRAAARNALGKHRAALSDLQSAAEIDPSSKEVKKELNKTLETLKTAVRRAPKTRVKVVSAPQPAPRPRGYKPPNDGETSSQPPAWPTARTRDVAAEASYMDSPLTPIEGTPAPFSSVLRETSDPQCRDAAISPVNQTAIEQLGGERSQPPFSALGAPSHLDSAVALQDAPQVALVDAVPAENHVEEEAATANAPQGDSIDGDVARASVGATTSPRAHPPKVTGSTSGPTAAVSQSIPSASGRAAVETSPSADAEAVGEPPTGSQDGFQPAKGEATRTAGRNALPTGAPLSKESSDGASVVRDGYGKSPDVAGPSRVEETQQPLARKRTAGKVKAPVRRSTGSAGGSVPVGRGGAQPFPSTGYQFEQMWRSTESSKDARLELLRTVPPSSVAKIFRRTPLEVELLGGVLCCLGEAFLPRRPVTALRWLKSLSKAARFGMTVALLGEGPGRAASRELLVRLESAPPEKVDPLEVETLRKMYLV